MAILVLLVFSVLGAFLTHSGAGVEQLAIGPNILIRSQVHLSKLRKFVCFCCCPVTFNTIVTFTQVEYAVILFLVGTEALPDEIYLNYRTGDELISLKAYAWLSS